MASERGGLGLLEENAATLFLAGGVLYVVFVANRILSTYTGTSFGFAEVFAWVSWVLIGFGLLGLYPALVERRPYLSRVAAALLVVPIVCSAVVAIGTGVLEPTGILTEPPGPVALAPLVALVTMYLAFALYGITVLLADIHPRALGVIMLAVAVLYPLWMTVLSGLPSFIANGINMVAYLAIGVVLLTADGRSEGVGTPADPTA